MEIEEYFSQLDKDTLDKLYKVYEMDFVLFNYTIDSFYPLVKNKTENIYKISLGPHGGPYGEPHGPGRVGRARGMA